MRQMYWILFVGLCLTVVIGNWTFPVPAHGAFENITSVEFNSWYLDRLRSGLILGAAIGIGSALLTSYTMKVNASDDSESFAQRTLRRAFVYVALAGFLALIFGIVSGTTTSAFEGVSSPDRLDGLSHSSRFWVTVAGAVLMAQFAFAIVTWTRRWAGRYAILRVRNGF